MLEPTRAINRPDKRLYCRSQEVLHRPWRASRGNAMASLFQVSMRMRARYSGLAPPFDIYGAECASGDIRKRTD
jgi:hypothetical protein